MLNIQNRTGGALLKLTTQNQLKLTMTQRLIFIHGFGENESIFTKIAPALGGQQVMVDVWQVLGNNPRPNLNIPDFAQELINRFGIGPQDVVIGHSMGGWIAYHIKAHVGCRIVQIGSWTHFDRVISPIRSAKTIEWLVRNGLYINRFQKWLFSLAYKNLPSYQIFTEVFEDLVVGNKENVISQMKLIFEPTAPLSVTPDLRIHAQADKVILPPKEPFHEVPGDHFTLITHPETVIAPIRGLLDK